MKTAELLAFGSIQNIHFSEKPIPTPGPGEVLVRMKAASLNYRDLIVLKGTYPSCLPPPLTPLSDGAGVVEACGVHVARWKKGDAVIGSFFQNWVSGPMHKEVPKSALGGSLPGVLAEYVLYKEEGLVPKPAHLSFEEAATLPCAALTAWHALVEKGSLQKNETVLILGTGGVSLFGLQFAKSIGARVIITSSQHDKLEKTKILGADDTINYRTTPDWEKTVFELTHQKGVDHILEVGGAGTLTQSIQAAAYGGRIHLIGMLTGATGLVNPRPITGKSLTLQGIFVGSRQMLERMITHIETHRIHPVIDRVFAFEETPKAYEHLESGSHFGKVCIVI